ncbi:hypothetical protein [Enterobacter cloacae]|nr:hypothetical protein [Enterobacter cloacae]MDS0029893.1 hypothetical protein [Enterobacter cloacae subsp. cloacae]
MALYGKIRFAGVYRLARFTSRIGITDTPIKLHMMFSLWAKG